MYVTTLPSTHAEHKHTKKDKPKKSMHSLVLVYTIWLIGLATIQSNSTGRNLFRNKMSDVRYNNRVAIMM